MTRKQRTKVIHDMSDIPEFANETEEHEFWDTHALGDELLEQVPPEDRPELDLQPRSRTRSTPVTIRFEDQLVARLRALAERRGMRYQTLLKGFVAERLFQEEEREGIIPSPDAGTGRDAGRRTTSG